MTKQDDWSRFCEMMAAAGWRLTDKPLTWVHDTGSEVYYYNQNGYISWGDKTIADNDVYVHMENGTTPIPF